MSAADPVFVALRDALHKRHESPRGFDSRAVDCLTCREDALIAYAVVASALERESEAREVLRLIEEYEPGTKGPTLRYIQERVAAYFVEGAKG